MRGYLLKTGLLILAALFSAEGARAEAAAETMRFAVMRNGQQIGSNTIELRRNGSETTVHMVTHVEVKIAFVTVYRFDQTETERWVGGKLMALNAVTDDNGTPHRVKATRANDKLAIEADGKATEIAGNTIPASLWNPLLLEKTVAFNPQDGTMMPIAVTDRREAVPDMRHARPDFQRDLTPRLAHPLGHPRGVVAQDLVAADLEQRRRQSARIAVKRRDIRIAGVGAAAILGGQGQQVRFVED